jgi:hypothetical protein
MEYELKVEKMQKNLGSKNTPKWRAPRDCEIKQYMERNSWLYF